MSQAAYQTATQTEYAGYQALLAIEAGLPRYNARVVSSMVRSLRAPRNVLEFGAGIGTLAREWLRQTGVKPDCVEIDRKQRVVLQDRGFSSFSSLSQLLRKYDAIYSANVLEHIDEDVAAMKELRECLVPGGKMAAYVPACNSLYSSVDAALGHYRRYSRRELISKCEKAGFTIEYCAYSDCLGYLSWMAVRLLGGDSSELGNVGRLQLYDRWIHPVSRALDGAGMKHLIGKNLMLIARR